MFNKFFNSKKKTGKIFCIGYNKTGTTSLAGFFKMNGYKVGDQATAELLIEDWAKGNFKNIISYCSSENVFQDIPFSLDGTFQAMDEAFPGSKFILSERDSGDEWFNSLVRFHSKVFADGKRVPTESDLREARIHYKGFFLRVFELAFGYPSIPLYDKEHYIRQYNQYNEKVRSYFSDRPEIFLPINLKDANATEKLCKFLNIDILKAKPIPHLNKSQ